MIGSRNRFARAGLACLALSLASCGDDDGGDRSISLHDASVAAGEPTGLAGITDLHNQTRAMASPTPNPTLPPLTWSDSLAADAAAWADGCQWKHSDNHHGENIYASAGFTPDAGDVVTSWVSEAPNYSYGSNSCAGGKVCGHYTQVVWRATTTLGCAIKACSTGSPFSGATNWTFVVCDYDPPGNSGGKPY